MPWRDLDRARAQFGIGMFVGDHLEAAAGDRLEDVLADHAPVARIVGVYRDRHVGEHRFGARRRDDDMVAPVIECHAVGEGKFEVPRSEERGVGEECVSTCRWQWSAECTKKKKKKN